MYRKREIKFSYFTRGEGFLKGVLGEIGVDIISKFRHCLYISSFRGNVYSTEHGGSLFDV